MKLKAIFSILLVFPLCSCGFLSNSGPSSDVVTGAAVGTVAGAGIGTAIGAAITDGDIGRSALLGAGVGLAVGVVGVYAYDKMKPHWDIASNDEAIENNRLELVAEQAEVDKLRQEIYEESQSIVVDSSKREKIYNGATLGVYYR